MTPVCDVKVGQARLVVAKRKKSCLAKSLSFNGDDHYVFTVGF